MAVKVILFPTTVVLSVFMVLQPFSTLNCIKVDVKETYAGHQLFYICRRWVKQLPCKVVVDLRTLRVQKAYNIFSNVKFVNSTWFCVSLSLNLTLWWWWIRSHLIMYEKITNLGNYTFIQLQFQLRPYYCMKHYGSV